MMMRIGVWLLSAVTLFGQPTRDVPRPLSGTGTLRGRIVAAATGGPIPNARVSIADDHDHPPVLSDEEGRFVFVALPARAFTITASKTGFAKTIFGAPAANDVGTPVTVRDRAVVDGIVIALPRGAAVGGMVVDDTGEPVPGASVMIEPVLRSGRATAVPVVALTDETGTYRIGSLGEGAVRVSVFAAARSKVMEPGGSVLTEGRDHGQRVYYPGGLKAERGEPVVLHAGDERLDLDFVTAARIPIGPKVAPTPRDATAVSGRIISSSGRPLSGARVALAPTGSTDAPQRQTVSDEAGAYQFVLPAKASGTFRIVATRVGYVSGWYGQHDERDVPEEIAVVAGDQIMDRNITLASTSTIMGRIFDERGDAIEGAAIRASTIRFIDGQRRLVRAPVATAYTDDVGAYRLFGLPAGDYIVSAVVGQIVGTEVSADLPGYATTYYPGTPNPAEAQFVSVGRSREVTGVTCSLVRTLTARVTGQAFDSAGEPIGGGIMLAPSARSGVIASVSLGARLDRDGHFEFMNVPPGEYVLQVSRHRQGSWNEGDTASQFVTVNGTDVSGLEVHASSGSTVTGRIIVESEAVVTPGQLELLAQPVDPDLTVTNAGPPARARINDDLHFELAGLQGPRRLRLLRVPAGFALKQIRLNGSDVTDVTLAFGRRNQSLDDVEVVLTTEVAEMSGSVANAQGQPLTNARVMVFAVDPSLRYAESRFLGHAMTDRDGHYRLEGLPPGDYYVSAIDRRTQGDLEDPDFLESLAAHATRATLSERAHLVISLKAQ